MQTLMERGCGLDRNVAVLRADQQVPSQWPGTARSSASAGLSRIETVATIFPPGLSVVAGMARAAHASLRAQMVHRLFLQYVPCLDEQARRRDTGSSANRKSVPAISPGSVYAQRRSATSDSRLGNTSSVATLRSKPAGPHHEHDRQGRAATLSNKIVTEADRDTANLLADESLVCRLMQGNLQRAGAHFASCSGYGHRVRSVVHRRWRGCRVP